MAEVWKNGPPDPLFRLVCRNGQWGVEVIATGEMVPCTAIRFEAEAKGLPRLTFTTFAFTGEIEPEPSRGF